MLILIIIVLVFAVAFAQGLIYQSNQREKERLRKILNIEKVNTKDGHYPILKIPGNTRPERPKDISYNDFRPKSGAHDNFFANKLKQYFGDKIKMDVRLSNRYPDIALINEKTKFYLDIEIDEVYDLESKFALHSVGTDDLRNEYFIRKGWYVLRFTEEQVVKQTLSCCKYVSQVYAYFTLDKKPLYFLTAIQDVNFNEQWDFEKANRLANGNFREKELGVVKIEKKERIVYPIRNYDKNDPGADLPF